eukprot:98226-Pyramimonas_sp.AAC.1
MHAVRAIAGSSPEIQAAQRWITEAMDPVVDDEQLKYPGRFQRLDIMIATDLIEKFTQMRRNRSLPSHHTHFLPSADQSNGVRRPEWRETLDGT